MCGMIVLFVKGMEFSSKNTRLLMVHIYSEGKINLIRYYLYDFQNPFAINANALFKLFYKLLLLLLPLSIPPKN